MKYDVIHFRLQLLIGHFILSLLSGTIIYIGTIILFIFLILINVSLTCGYI